MPFNIWGELRRDSSCGRELSRRFRCGSHAEQQRLSIVPLPSVGMVFCALANVVVVCVVLKHKKKNRQFKNKQLIKNTTRQTIASTIIFTITPCTEGRSGSVACTSFFGFGNDPRKIRVPNLTENILKHEVTLALLNHWLNSRLLMSQLSYSTEYRLHSHSSIYRRTRV